MKTYEEMAQNALDRINNYKTEKKKRRKTVVKIAAPTVSFCLVAMLCVSAWQSGLFKTKAPLVDADNTVLNNFNKVSEHDKSDSNTAGNNTDTNKSNIDSDKKSDTQIITGDSTGKKGADTNPTDGCIYFRWNNLNLGGALKNAIDNNPDSVFAIFATYRTTSSNITSFIYEGKTLAEWSAKAFEENASQDEIKGYKLAYNAYLGTVLQSAVSRLTENGIRCKRVTYMNNGLTLLATAEELKKLPLENLESWSFDLASDDLKGASNSETDATGLKILK